MKKTLILALAIVLSLGLMACSSSSGGGVKQCVGLCSKTADCSTGEVCSSGNCVQCAVDADCANYGNRGCNTGVGACKQCTKDADCVSVGTGKCDSNFICNKCTANADCTSSFIGTVCGPGSTCVECNVDADCSSNSTAKMCGAGNVCVACKVDADCGTGQKCYSGTYQGYTFGVCFPLCTSDAVCATFTQSSGYTCNTGSGECACDEAKCKVSEPNSTKTFTCE